MSIAKKLLQMLPVHVLKTFPFVFKQVEQFIIDHPDQGSGERAFVQSIAVIKGNIRWMEQYYNEVADWVEDAA